MPIHICIYTPFRSYTYVRVKNNRNEWQTTSENLQIVRNMASVFLIHRPIKKSNQSGLILVTWSRTPKKKWL
ncbi:hypothetical protein M5D96_006871 [Drosophila gunungcola]|uniref:Uncharacterized protein n=1 Tax=Drosophila gunungcola TaxID=103775 RepID=A0A9P9YQI9_9MUSC|nr:hypothetical protein M5D96_006871 [Drosophila gunungcola]